MEFRDLRWLSSAGIASAAAYDIAGARPGTHLGVPGPTVTVIVDLRDGLELTGPGLAHRTRFRICVGGLHTAAFHIHHDGAQRGVQLELTPDGVRGLFGCPVGELATGPIELSALSAAADELYQRTAAAPEGEAAPSASALLATLAAPGDRGHTPHPDAARTWQLLAARRGLITVRELTAASGWSARYLATHFTREYGMGIKAAARLHRFHHARLRLESGVPAATVAAEHGYADQAHLSREFREFLGVSPTAFLVGRANEFTPA